MTARPQMSRAHRITLILFIVFLILPAAWKFVEKLLLFIQAAREDGGDTAFAIVPVANYLIVFLGMLCLLVWAISNGMFRDIEEPKYTLLEKERRLDELAGQRW